MCSPAMYSLRWPVSGFDLHEPRATNPPIPGQVDIFTVFVIFEDVDWSRHDRGGLLESTGGSTTPRTKSAKQSAVVEFFAMHSAPGLRWPVARASIFLRFAPFPPLHARATVCSRRCRSLGHAIDQEGEKKRTHVCFFGPFSTVQTTSPLKRQKTRAQAHRRPISKPINRPLFLHFFKKKTCTRTLTQCTTRSNLPKLPPPCYLPIYQYIPSSMPSLSLPSTPSAAAGAPIAPRPPGPWRGCPRCPTDRH